MTIVAIAWIYVVLMMSITEESVIAGLVTFFFYGIFPLAIILYVMQAPERRRKRLAAEKIARDEAIARHAAKAAAESGANMESSVESSGREEPPAQT